MYKTLPIVALLLTTTACSIDQKPAPYVEKGNERFSKSAGKNAYSSTATTYGNNDYIDATANRSDIGSSEIQSRSLMPDTTSAPINRNDGVIDFANSQQNSGLYKTGQARPIVSSDYIDSEENSGKTSAVQLAPLNAANNYAPTNSYASAAVHPRPVLDDEPTSAPATNTGKGYLNLGAVNNFNSPAAGTVTEPKKTSKLLNARPLAKPAYKPVEEAVETTPATTQEAPIAIETTTETTTKAVVEPTTSSIAIPAAPVTTTDTITVPAAPVEAAPLEPAPAPVVEKTTTKISDNESVTTTKTIERVEPKPSDTKNDEAAIEKAPIVEEEKPVASDSKQFIRPVQGEVVGKFGNEPDGTFNDGIKIKASKGTDVKAADSGEVVYSGNQLQGYGNMIIIRHANGYLTSYAHLENLDIKKGSKVGQGAVIGHVGDTGNVTEPMLHFGVREGREPVDPQKFLK